MDRYEWQNVENNWHQYKLHRSSHGIEDGKDRTTYENGPGPPTNQTSQIHTGAVTEIKKQAGVTKEEFDQFKSEKNIRIQGVDYDEDLVLNVGEEFVSFEKGCYLGQEIVARVHYRGSPPKRLAVKKQSECTPEEFPRMTSKVELNGQITGFLFVS